VTAVRCGLFLSIPATVLASWAFYQTDHRALEEAALAGAAVAVVLVTAWSLHGDTSSDVTRREQKPLAWST
jgi:Ca2+/H+ antiporter